MISVITNETAVCNNPYPGMSLAEACSSLELTVSEACNDFQMNILLTEHAYLYANGSEMDYMDEAGNLNEKAAALKEKAGELVSFCQGKIMELWDKLTEWFASAVENFKAALTKRSISEKDFNLVKSHASEVFAEPIEMKAEYAVSADFLNSRNYSEMMAKSASDGIMDAVEYFVKKGENTISVKPDDFEFAYKMVFSNEILKKIRDAKKEVNTTLKEQIAQIKKAQKSDDFQSQVAGLKGAMKANVATTNSLIRVYHMYINQKIAILRVVMNSPVAKKLVHDSHLSGKAANAVRGAGEKVAATKAGVAVKSAADKVGGAAKEAGEKVANAARGAGEKVGEAVKGARKHFTRKD